MSVNYNGVCINIIGYAPNKVYWEWDTGDSDINKLLEEFVLRDATKFAEIDEALFQFSKSQEEALMNDIKRMFGDCCEY